MLGDAERCLLIHHWDADGVCSAAQLYEELSSKNVKLDLYTPAIGSYRLSGRDVERFKQKSYGCVIVADISLPKQNILKLKELAKSLFMFDHHIQKQIPNVQIFNPVLSGREDCPSTSWVIKDFFGRKTDLLAVLGAVGDYGEDVKRFKIYGEINEFLRSFGLKLRDALRMVELVDSNYKVGDELAVREAVFKLIRCKDYPKRILEDEDWIKKAEAVRGEVRRCLQSPIEVYGKIVFKEIDSKFNVISTVTRSLSRSNPGKVVVVVNREFGEESQIYIRESGLKVDLAGIIGMARKRGYVAGGRRNSIGVVLPKDSVELFLGEVKGYLEGLI